MIIEMIRVSILLLACKLSEGLFISRQRQPAFEFDLILSEIFKTVPCAIYDYRSG
jgi:hypothetical protein